MEKLTQSFKVQGIDTAVALGSGTLEVLATPRMIAWMENTAMKLCAHHCQMGECTVGIAITANHIKASKIGAEITIEATLDTIDGRKLSLTITASDDNGNEIGNAKHERFVVNNELFMSKL